jgi:uncharacterized protein YuzE
MTDMTYDPEADAVYIYIGTSRKVVDHTEEAGPFIYDVDGEGRVVGIEILSASEVLAPGDWQKARLPGASRVDAAE